MSTTRTTTSRGRTRKAELIELILQLHDLGLTSPTLIGEALGVNKAYVWRILVLTQRRKNPRNSLADTMAGLPTTLRDRVLAFRAARRPAFDMGEKAHEAAD